MVPFMSLLRQRLRGDGPQHHDADRDAAPNGRLPVGRDRDGKDEALEHAQDGDQDGVPDCARAQGGGDELLGVHW